eukprot:s1225_g21.t1
MWRLWTLACASVGARPGGEEVLPGITDYQLIDAYEELVASVTKMTPLGLEDLPQRLVLFSTWYIASRTLWSALRGESCACYFGTDNPSNVPPMLRTRICEMDLTAIETVSPFLFGGSDVLPTEKKDQTPPVLWAMIAKRAMYLAEVTRTHQFQGDPELEASMMSMADLAASELGTSWMTGRPPRIGNMVRPTSSHGCLSSWNRPRSMVPWLWWLLLATPGSPTPCSAKRAFPDHRELSQQTLISGLTSPKFKQDIIDLFRSNRYAQTTALEIGAGTGTTTAALAVNFGTVVATEVFWEVDKPWGEVDLTSTDFLPASQRQFGFHLDPRRLFKRDGSSFNNIVKLHMDAKLPFGLSVLVEQNISAAVIDAQHDFLNVVGETMAVLRQIPCCVETIVYHDYCNYNVYGAIRFFVDAGILAFRKHMGLPMFKDFKCFGSSLPEGVAMRVLRHSAGFWSRLETLYGQYVSNPLYPDPKARERSISAQLLNATRWLLIDGQVLGLRPQQPRAILTMGFAPASCVLEELSSNPLSRRNTSEEPLLRPTERLGSMNLFQSQMRSARKLPLLSIPILENEKVIGKVWLEVDRGMNLMTMEFEDGRALMGFSFRWSTQLLRLIDNFLHLDGALSRHTGVWIPQGSDFMAMSPTKAFRHPPPPVLACWPPTCMSRGPSAEPGTIELSVSLPGGLSVRITAPASASSLATQLLSHVAAFEPVSPAPSEFEVLSSVGASSPRGSVLSRPLETRDQIRRSFGTCPPALFGFSPRLCGSSLSGRARVERAWLCGQWAAAVRANRIHSPDRTEPIDLKSRYYAVLRARGLSKPTIFKSSAGYWACIGRLETSDSISQAFPSETEARIYLQSAGVEEIEELVTLEQDVAPYVIEWPVVSDDDGVPEVAGLVISKRPGGFLAGVPVGFIPEEVLAAGNLDAPPGLVGPSTVLELPGMVLEQGVLSPTGTTVSVVVVDLAEEVVGQMRPLVHGEVYAFTYDVDQPFAIPAPQDLLAAAREWVTAGAAAESSALPYFSAEGEEEDLTGVAEEDGPEAPATPPVTRRKARVQHGPEKPSAAGKKPTVASLAASVDQLLKMNAGLVKSMEDLAGRQKQLERQSSAPLLQNQTPHVALRQPISSSLPVPAAQPMTVAHMVGTPPRTAAPSAAGLLRSPMLQPPELKELEDEKPRGDPAISSDHLAQAVLAQSQALTALVSQIAHQSSDPLLELSSGSASASTRGAQGRSRLQAELASQKGLFFQAVLSSMARRMQPTASVEGSPQELLDRGICGTRYLERFGGYGRVRELGCLQQQVMSIMDCHQSSNLQAARDQTALLAVAIDQAALDQGRFELANLLCLQEEPPATVFSNRPMNVLGKPRAFTPLADQKWVTVALAYIKELDVITTKRQELTSSGRQGTFVAGSGGGENPSSGNPKAKASTKKKAKGGGRNSQQAANAEGEEA